MTRTMVWFRRDLRTTDNTALDEAARASSRGVVGVFVVCPAEWRAHDDAAVKIDFWLRSAAALSRELASLNIPLLVVRAESTREIAPRLLEAARRAQCDALAFNHEYEVNERARDEVVARVFEKAGLKVRGFHDHVLFDPASVRTGEGRFYSVYTPFKKAVLKRLAEEWPAVRPAPPRQAETGIAPDPVPTGVEGFESAVDPALWPAGERHAQRELARFCESSIAEYKDRRDTPAIDGTSRLSPYLNSGIVSPRQCIAAARERNGGALDDRRPGTPGPAHWISEVIWREFYQHVLVGFPRVSRNRAFRPETERLRWNQNDEHVERWKRGLTGVPIVDAGMRQMAATGWMHNRVRMITAMYFTKDLFLDWRIGERHFMRCLIDGDLGSNNGGWQWSASTGTDAAPYFRIFNPYSQSERCDPDGAYIRAWVPELAGVEGDAVHDPSRLPGLLRGQVEYPEPMAPREGVRERVMAAFSGLRDGQ